MISCCFCYCCSVLVIGGGTPRRLVLPAVTGVVKSCYYCFYCCSHDADDRRGNAAQTGAAGCRGFLLLLLLGRARGRLAQGAARVLLSLSGDTLRHRVTTSRGHVVLDFSHFQPAVRPTDSGTLARPLRCTHLPIDVG